MDLVRSGINHARQMRNWFLSSAVLLAVLIVFGGSALAQMDTGTITGVLRDQQGAVLAGATVTIRNLARVCCDCHKDERRRNLPDPSGLIPGIYSVEAMAQGLARLKILPSMSTSDSCPSRFQPQSGRRAQEQIEVHEIGAQLQTQSADVATLIGTNADLTICPLNSRRYADLALLSPGIFKNPSVANTAPGSLQLERQLGDAKLLRARWRGQQLGLHQFQEGSVQNVQPPPDAIQEFRLQTRTYSTEFGTSAGAVVNASIKSGTNQFHGNVWEYAP